MNKYEKQVEQLQLNKEKQVLKDLKTMYRKALDGVNEMIVMLMSDPTSKSKAYQAKYQAALKKQIETLLDVLQNKEFDTINEFLKESYDNGYIGTMYAIKEQGIPLMLPISQEQVIKAIQLDSKISKGLYERLGEDVKELKKKIRSEVSRGISTGMSYTDMSRNISNVSNVGINNAMRIARTESHRIKSAASYDAALEAKKKGADIVLQWDATLDGKTRQRHKRLDGEIRELGETFSNGLRYPGDEKGSAAEVINCRCVALTRARWGLDEDELKELERRAAYYDLDKSENFEDYKKKYLKASEQKAVDIQKGSKSTIDETGKKNEKDTPAKSIDEINKEATEKMLDAYDDRRKHFNLNLVPADELRTSLINPIKADYRGVSAATASAFNDTINNLFKEYYSSFTKISVGDKKKYFASPVFASTAPVNTLAQSELILNPYKVGNYDKLCKRIKELSDKGYTVRIKSGSESKYVATHEFAHSLINLKDQYKNYVNMDVKQMEVIRKEINAMFDVYKKEVSALESEYKKKELALLNASIDADIEELEKIHKEVLKAKQAYDAVIISKYSLENADEFTAEAFAQAKLGKTQSEYSKRVMAILDKNFKKEPLENAGKSGTIKSITIHKSLGAAAKNYPVKLLDSRQHTKLAEGQVIEGTTFAGRGTDTDIRDRFRLESTYKIAADKWEKVSGKGKVIVDGKAVMAELHWYEADGEVFEMKVKRYLDES